MQTSETSASKIKEVFINLGVINSVVEKRVM